MPTRSVEKATSDSLMDEIMERNTKQTKAKLHKMKQPPHVSTALEVKGVPARQRRVALSTQGRSDPSASAAGTQWGLVLWSLLTALCLPVSLVGLLVLRESGVRWPDFGDGMNAAFRSSMTFAAVLVLLYLGLNCGLSLLNRWALGLYGLKFPIIMTATHMIFGSFALAPMLVLSDAYTLEHVPTLRSSGWALALVAVLNGVQIACNNASLGEIELSMNQIVRAFCPVLTALLGVSIEGKTPSSAELLALLMVSLGVVVCVYEESMRGSLLGLSLVGASAFVQSAQMSVSSRIMTRKLDSFQMTFYTGGISYLVLLPLGLYYEGGVFVGAVRDKPLAVVGFLLGSCLMAVCYNVVFFQCMKTLSSVGTGILGNVKIVLLIMASAMLLGELSSWPPSQYAGCMLTFAGTAFYSHLRQQVGKK